MAVKIGHASINEFGKVKGGKKGDQTGREVCVRTYYVHKKTWGAVIRPNDPKDAEILASTMEKICANDNFGYGQEYSMSGFNESKKYNFDPSKVRIKCEVDCSMAVRIACYAAGIEVERFRTKNEASVLKATEKFKILTSDKYCKSSKYLKRGDILCTPEGISGHTVIVLSDGEEVVKENKKPETTHDDKPAVNNKTSNKKYNEAKVKVAKYFNKSVAGTYVTITNLNLRYGAGAVNEKILTMPKGTKINCYGYYNKALDVKWYLVEYKGYVGYCSSSSKYLKKSK